MTCERKPLGRWTMLPEPVPATLELEAGTTCGRVLTQPMWVPCGTTAAVTQVDLRVALVIVDGESEPRPIEPSRIVGWRIEAREWVANPTALA